MNRRPGSRGREAVPGGPGDLLGDAADLTAAFADALDAGVVVLDGHDVVLANQPAYDLRLVRGSTLVGNQLARLVAEARAHGERVRDELELPWGDGVRAVIATASAVVGSTRAVLVVQDLTESRRVEAVRRDFVASVSHELKTPVGALLLLAETVRDSVDGDPEAAQRFAERMVVEATRLSRLVQELMDLSRLQGGEPLPASDTIDVPRLVADAFDRVRLAAETAQIELASTQLDGLAVYGDVRSLTTALVNLVDNAIHYSPPGTRVTVAARSVHEASGAFVEVSVTDQGIGIAEADMDRVFERFYRSDPARSRETGGTGLGLAIVKHAVENAGGRVSVWSMEGVGSTFTLHLPPPPASATNDLVEPARLGVVR